MTSADKAFLRYLSTYNELGLYSVTVAIAGAAAVLQQMFSTVWTPTLYKATAQGNESALVTTANQHVLAAVAAIFPALGCSSWLLSYLFPSDYFNIRYIVLCCFAQPLFYAISETTVAGINLKRRSFLSVLATLAALGINVGGNMILIPRYGAAGAAAATAISFWVFLVFRTEASARVWRSFPRRTLYVLSFVLSCSGGNDAIWTTIRRVVDCSLDQPRRLFGSNFSSVISGGVASCLGKS